MILEQEFVFFSFDEIKNSTEFELRNKRIRNRYENISIIHIKNMIWFMCKFKENKSIKYRT